MITAVERQLDAILIGPAVRAIYAPARKPVLTSPVLNLHRAGYWGWWAIYHGRKRVATVHRPA